MSDRIGRRRPDRRLGIEIASVLAVKLIVLWLIWWTWFSVPVARHMHVDPAAVERHIIAPRGAE